MFIILRAALPSLSPPAAASCSFPKLSSAVLNRRDASPLSQMRHTFLHDSSSLQSCDSAPSFTAQSIIVKQARRSAITSQSLASPSPPRPFSNCCRLSVGVSYYESSSSYHSHPADEMPVHPALGVPSCRMLAYHCFCAYLTALICPACRFD